MKSKGGVFVKRVVSVLIVLLLILTVAVAESDLASLSFDELLELRNQLNAEIMSRPEWKEVTVPTGTWYTGIDIPVGFYSIIATDDHSMVRLEDKNEHYIFYKTMSKNEVAGKVYFEEGSVLQIYDPIILAPPISLGF